MARGEIDGDNEVRSWSLVLKPDYLAYEAPFRRALRGVRRSQHSRADLAGSIRCGVAPVLTSQPLR